MQQASVIQWHCNIAADAVMLLAVEAKWQVGAVPTDAWAALVPRILNPPRPYLAKCGYSVEQTRSSLLLQLLSLLALPHTTSGYGI